jgi:hypothetical protein
LRSSWLKYALHICPAKKVTKSKTANVVHHI